VADHVHQRNKIEHLHLLKTPIPVKIDAYKPRYILLKREDLLKMVLTETRIHFNSMTVALREDSTDFRRWKYTNEVECFLSLSIINQNSTKLASLVDPMLNTIIQFLCFLSIYLYTDTHNSVFCLLFLYRTDKLSYSVWRKDTH